MHCMSEDGKGEPQKAETNSNVCNLVMKVKPQRWNSEDIQPCRLQTSSTEQPGVYLAPWSCHRVQQLLLCHFNVLFIPRSLDCFIGVGWGVGLRLLVSLLPLITNLQNMRKGGGILQPISVYYDQNVLCYLQEYSKGY